MTLLADPPEARPSAETQLSWPSLKVAEPPFVWARQIRSAIDAVIEIAPPRALVVGNAGSGKSATLRHLQGLLTAHERDAVYVRPDATDISRFSRSQVLLVDDLHRFSREQVAQLRERSEDPDAALIAALRPSAWSEQVAAIVHSLEQHRPAVVLGHLSRSDLLNYLENSTLFLTDSCVDHILKVTGGVSWLVSESLRAHDERDCRDDTSHRELRGALEERIAHRLDMIDPILRRTIEQICIAPPGHMLSILDTSADGVIVPGYAEGLLMRSGQPVPLVRSTVHATIPVQRLLELSEELADGIAHSAAAGDSSYQAWVGLLHDKNLGTALVRHADQLLQSDPARAAELYLGAVQSGIDPDSLAGKRAQGAWAAGELDAASALVDDATSQENSVADARSDLRIIDTSAAIWAARGMMDQACAVYRANPPANAISATRAAIADFGIGSIGSLAAAREPGRPDDPVTTPTALGVSMALLRRGLAASVVVDQAESALADLVRASEMYTTSRTSAGIPELPAVLAAIVALNLGGLATADSVIDDAISGGQGGPWAKPRLLLWRAWIAVQRARPAEARDALAEAKSAMADAAPRDVLLAGAVQVAIARRYEDAAGLESAWRNARGTLLRVDVDLFLLHPLAELISSASRVGDIERIQPQFQRALELTERFGSPALWSAHLRWAGIQNGILRSSPESLRPHAKALVDASADSRVAAIMAKAGRVWTSVLGGTVDADAVEKAAHGLASIGLVWDAARLAGHGAARSEDRKISARLLACARELHPVDGTRSRVAPAATDSGTSMRTPPDELLSERELEVARLVLEGKTYAEIGETIFISPRTAEHHIAHIRRRLGATSRSEVIAKLRQLLGGQFDQSVPSRANPHSVDGPP
ncbi:LuxR family transcriptional regulator [Microbacterium sp. CH12i]|uniref:LuxR C-terminal-related transcriptional regulator n=1 Tax=Microbacterium sp. CH12i TaxID=1479651 RepID=UPI000460EA02|nr:LuxR C-terminal-related transcriptional regulator [Microbacterium sp. CH12i]KDA06406.1 LuxR family transcriptional regulator [Microbacterium sp. CH12i]